VPEFQLILVEIPLAPDQGVAPFTRARSAPLLRGRGEFFNLQNFSIIHIARNVDDDVIAVSVSSSDRVVMQVPAVQKQNSTSQHLVLFFGAVVPSC